MINFDHLREGIEARTWIWSSSGCETKDERTHARRPCSDVSSPGWCVVRRWLDSRDLHRRKRSGAARHLYRALNSHPRRRVLALVTFITALARSPGCRDSRDLPSSKAYRRCSAFVPCIGFPPRRRTCARCVHHRAGASFLVQLLPGSPIAERRADRAPTFVTALARRSSSALARISTVLRLRSSIQTTIPLDKIFRLATQQTRESLH